MTTRNTERHDSEINNKGINNAKEGNNNKGEELIGNDTYIYKKNRVRCNVDVSLKNEGG